MLRIPCPNCGPRDEVEFTYGGPSHVTRPELTASDREWSHYLYHRANTKGLYRERWLHAYGCGRWFNVVRDTRTNEILQTYPMGSTPPMISADPASAAQECGGSNP